jgi:hypothetical protein
MPGLILGPKWALADTRIRSCTLDCLPDESIQEQCYRIMGASTRCSEDRKREYLELQKVFDWDGYADRKEAAMGGGEAEVKALCRILNDKEDCTELIR